MAAKVRSMGETVAKTTKAASDAGEKNAELGEVLMGRAEMRTQAIRMTLR